MPQNAPSDPKVKLITVAVAAGSVGTLAAMAAAGLFSMMPTWAGVMIVVVEILIPIVVFRFLKRAQRGM